MSDEKAQTVTIDLERYVELSNAETRVEEADKELRILKREQSSLQSRYASLKECYERWTTKYGRRRHK